MGTRMKIEFTADELAELFSRCLSSPMEDTPTSVTALQKLAAAIESLSNCRAVAA